MDDGGNAMLIDAPKQSESECIIVAFSLRLIL